MRAIIAFRSARLFRLNRIYALMVRRAGRYNPASGLTLKSHLIGFGTLILPTSQASPRVQRRVIFELSDKGGLQSVGKLPTLSTSVDWPVDNPQNCWWAGSIGLRPGNNKCLVPGHQPVTLWKPLGLFPFESGGLTK